MKKYINFIIVLLIIGLSYFLFQKETFEEPVSTESNNHVKTKTHTSRNKNSKPLNIRRINTRLIDAEKSVRDNTLKEFLVAKGIFDGKSTIDISEIKTLTFEELNNDELITVSYLPHLIELNIARTQVNNIDSLANLSELQHLNISATAVENIEALKDLNLKTLIMNETLVNNYNCLNDMKSLEYLDISKCNINELKTLKNLNNLVHLNISNTKITDLSPITSLSKIKKLIYTDSSIVTNSDNIELILRTR